MLPFIYILIMIKEGYMFQSDIPCCLCPGRKTWSAGFRDHFWGVNCNRICRLLSNCSRKCPKSNHQTRTQRGGQANQRLFRCKLGNTSALQQSLASAALT